jgi:hypothetical protein
MGNSYLENPLSLQHCWASKDIPNCKLVSSCQPNRLHPQHAMAMHQNPALLAFEALKESYSFDATPMAPLGTKVLAHRKPNQHSSWGFTHLTCGTSVIQSNIIGASRLSCAALVANVSWTCSSTSRTEQLRKLGRFNTTTQTSLTVWSLYTPQARV